MLLWLCTVGTGSTRTKRLPFASPSRTRAGSAHSPLRTAVCATVTLAAPCPDLAASCSDPRCPVSLSSDLLKRRGLTSGDGLSAAEQQRAMLFFCSRAPYVEPTYTFSGAFGGSLEGQVRSCRLASCAGRRAAGRSHPCCGAKRRAAADQCGRQRHHGHCLPACAVVAALRCLSCFLCLLALPSRFCPFFLP